MALVHDVVMTPDTLRKVQGHSLTKSCRPPAYVLKTTWRILPVCSCTRCLLLSTLQMA